MFIAYIRSAQLMIQWLSIQFKNWILVLYNIVIITIIFTLFCTLLCPADCGIAVVIGSLSFCAQQILFIKLFADLACKVQESSSEANRILRGDILDPFETRQLKGLQELSLPMGPFSTISRDTFPFALNDVIIAKLIDLLIAYK